MKQTPCEYIVWHGLPVLRKEIARSMINNFGLSQNEAAQRLGITPAAVSQYLSGKRGKLDISCNESLQEINISAERIIKQGNGITALEICRLCKNFSSKKLFNFYCDFCKDEDDIKK